MWLISRIDILSISNCPQVNATRLHWWLVNIGSGNGLVLSGAWINVDQVLWCHMASLGHIELICVNPACVESPCAQYKESRCEGKMILWPSYIHKSTIRFSILVRWQIYWVSPMFLCVRCPQCHAAWPHHDVRGSRLCSGGMRSRTCSPASCQGSQGVTCTMWYAARCANVDRKQRHSRGSSVGKVGSCDMITEIGNNN